MTMIGAKVILSIARERNFNGPESRLFCTVNRIDALGQFLYDCDSKALFGIGPIDLGNTAPVAERPIRGRA
jgi:hypothetical protein